MVTKCGHFSKSLDSWVEERGWRPRLCVRGWVQVFKEPFSSSFWVVVSLGGLYINNL